MDSVGLARVTLALAIFGTLWTGEGAVHAAPGATSAASGGVLGGALSLAADVDDDDANGVPDGQQGELSAAALVDAQALPGWVVGAAVHPLGGGDTVRIIAGGKPFPWDKPVPTGALLQGLRVGSTRLSVEIRGTSSVLEVEVRTAAFRDGGRRDVDPVLSHASLSRTPPAILEAPGDSAFDDPDALRVLVVAPEGSTRSPLVSVESVGEGGRRLDELAAVGITRVPCPDALRGASCSVTAPLRLVVDDVDRSHPLLAGRALRGEVGGALVVRDGGRKLVALRVQGPRSSSAGPIGRLRAAMRPIVFRVSPGSTPAVGSTDAGAMALVRSELAMASAIWGQCGVSLGDPKTIDVKIVDPPPPFLLALGDDLGVPASGGEVKLRVDGRPVSVTYPAGHPLDSIAADVARAVTRLGFQVVISPNARIGAGAAGSVDLLVRRAGGAFATLEGPAQGPLSTDATLSVRVGAVDLTDGLQHFRDVDAVAGTLEERTLLKSIDDGDPQTLEIVVVPSFTGGVRIGESFIGSDASSLRNAVVLDRAGIRARRSSLTLAHELGHVLLDMPDHPDDYGVDTPTLLMDSDASDASAFGPRRLGGEECARAVRESGPKARLPLLRDWPLAALKIDPLSR